MSITERDIRRAETLGRLAAKQNAGVKSCPYEANGNAEQRALAAKFVRAYLAAGGKTAVRFGDTLYPCVPGDE